MIYILSILLVLYGIGLCCTRYWMEYFIFLPKKLSQNYRFQFETPFEEHFLEVPGKGMINLLWFKVPEPKGTVLYFHGNADNLIRWGQIHKDFTRRGYNIVVPDYRGFGKSKGEKNEKKMLEDALQVYDFVAKETNTEKLILYGRSIGSAFAVYTASRKQPPLLILETPFFSISALFESYYPGLSSLFRYKFNFRNDLYIQQTSCPVWIFHGTWDTVVPYGHAIKYKQLLGERVHLVTLEGVNHKDCNTKPLYQQELDKAFRTMEEK
ncbi:MAG: lysophospholipase [Bacteroidia bacterium]|nr:lysophospholipase [Bacteroidia bacterium]